MDPNAALKTFVEALANCDHASALEAYINLADWLYMGGFEPKWTATYKNLFDAFNPKTGLLNIKVTATRPTPCLHKCKKPIPSTLFVRWHPFKPGWEIRECPHCRKKSAYSSIERM